MELGQRLMMALEKSTPHVVVWAWGNEMARAMLAPIKSRFFIPIASGQNEYISRNL
jgi:phage gp16-like protein